MIPQNRLLKMMVLLFQILIWVAPIATALFWAFTPPHIISSGIHSPNLVVNPLSRALAFLANGLPLGLGLYALVLLRRLFKNYQENQIFILANIKIYRRLSFLLLASVFVGTLYDALLGIIFSFQSGYIDIPLFFKSSDIKTILAAGIGIVIANVMQEARKIKEEQALTI